MSDEGDAEAAFFAAMFGHAKRKNEDLVRALTGQPAEPEFAQTEPEPAPSFDGGARETVPAPSDPEAEFNRLMGELLRRPTGGGGLW